MIATLSVKIHKVNGTIVFMPEIFKNIECSFDNYTICFRYEKYEFIIDIKSDTLDEKSIEKIFWNLYNYIGLLIGYFPNIKSATIMNEENLANIVEQYKTKDCFIRASEQFITSLNGEQFKSSFNKFLQIEEKASFQLSVFNISMMKNNSYPEIALINILQSLDGLYEVLFSNKNNNQKILDMKIKRLYTKLAPRDINDITNDERANIKNYMEKISDINFIDKLYFMCDIAKFDIFSYEKNLNDSNKYNFDNLISMFVNTRNKFSHIVTKNNILTGTAAAVYIFKIIILYRILLFSEIGIIDLVDEKSFIENLNEWDNYIFKTLKEDE